ncbi:hypothetical protein B0H13DRAFT_1853736 [Mycena leptocephala]|nr:hypothetical protein B0H13DRAFT_1853736 [Mycena leptocephala]
MSSPTQSPIASPSDRLGSYGRRPRETPPKACPKKIAKSGLKKPLVREVSASKATFRTGVVRCWGEKIEKKSRRAPGAALTTYKTDQHCVRFQRAVSYSRVDPFEYTGSKVEEDVRNFRVTAEMNPRILVIARKERRNEIGGFLIILAVVFPTLELLLNPESRRE